MKKNGFVTSALLYGILSLFLVLVLGTVAVTGNRKITIDKIKQSALDDAQDLTTPEVCFTTAVSENNACLKITGYNFNNSNCTKTVFIPETINGALVDSIGANAFRRPDEAHNLINVTIRSNILYIDSTAFSGHKNVLFIIKGKMPTGTTAADANAGRLWGTTDSSYRQD